MQFKKRYYLNAIAFYLIAIIAYVSYRYYNTEHELYAKIDLQLKTAALSVPQILPEQFHERRLHPASISREEDNLNIQRLSKQAKIFKLKFVYSLTRYNNKIIFTACSASDEELRNHSEVHYFDPYDDAPQGLIKAFNTNTVQYDEYTDQWGTFRSIFIPITTENHDLYVLAADLDISSIHHQLNNELYRSFLEIGYLVIILLPIFLLYRRHMQEITTHQEELIEQRTKELMEAKNAAEATTRTKSEFLATMSHEIRTPMNGVLGMLSLLERSSLTSTQRHHLSVAKGSATSLLGLINDILDFSKIEAGKMDLEILPFDLKKELNDFIELIAFKAEEKSLLLTLDTSHLTHTMIKGDPSRLRQILTNLVGNAIKFTSHGSIDIHVRLTTEHAPLARLLIDVHDSGIGIPSEKIPSLFDPFTQADGSTTRKYGGTGLGLSIVKQLCRLMNGRVSASSIPNEGSTFSIDISVELIDQEITLEPKNSVIQADLSTTIQWPTKTRILLVEDNPTNQIVALGLLDELGLNADIAGNGLEAIEALKLSLGIFPYTVVLMDCQMPEMDGYEASKAIRNGDAGQLNKKVPIVAMTANAMQGDKELCLASGMDDYLAKPINLSELKAMLIKWLLPALEDQTSDLINPEPSPLLQEESEQSPLWDREGALERLGGKEKFLTLVVNSFLSESSTIMKSLESALEGNDIPNIQLHTHSIKGSAGNIGATLLQEKAKELELGAKNGDIEAVQSQFPELKKVYDKTIELLDSHH